jgi:hypothetical protein
MLNSRTTWIVCLSLCALSLLLHAVLACFAHPMADDFSYAHKDLSQGIWNASVWEYLHWNGRYTSNFLVLLGPLRLGLNDLSLYRSVPIALIVLTLFAQLIFLQALRKRLGWTLPVFPIALLWCALYLALMPDIAEGFYWYTGSVTYPLGNALTLFSLASLLNGRFLFGGVMAFLCIGFNEVIMLLWLVGVLVPIILERRSGKRIKGRSIGLMLIVALGVAILLFAPGNAGRGQHFPEQHQLLPSLYMSALQTLRFAATWIVSPPLLIASLGFVLLRNTILPFLDPITSRLRPAMTGTGLALVIFLCAFPAYWGTGILGQHRTINVACFFFLPLWFLNLAVCLRAWSPRLPALSLSQLSPLLLVLGLSTIVSGNGLASVMDLVSGRARSSSEQLETRYRLLREAAQRAEGTVLLPLIKEPPKSIYVLDIRPDPDFLQNKDYALWFGLGDRAVLPADQMERANATN